MVPARRRADLGRHAMQTHKPHVIIVVRLELDAEHVGVVGVAPV